VGRRKDGLKLWATARTGLQWAGEARNPNVSAR
jgi:hypothetical protein